MSSSAPAPVHAGSCYRLQHWAATHPGAVRFQNQDTLLCCPEVGLWVVADGAGGHQEGHSASAMIEAALRGIPAALGPDEVLSQVRLRIAAVHHTLRERAQTGFGAHAIIASTVVALLIRDGFFACLWAGDSRAYLLRGTQMSYITKDHSLVQELVDSGVLSEEEAERHPQANVITRAVGGDHELELDKVTAEVGIGDRYLLCSDGLSKALSADRIAALTASMDHPANELIEAALAVGARDNVTAVVIEVLADA